MTHDQSETKFWYHGEYEQLDSISLDEKIDAHAKHCPFGITFSAASFPSSDYIYTSTTEDYTSGEK
jgi:hypothetical protein